ncbi:hypothetical protein GOEFS_046_00680 [Gordonia effusa NBRC 100432]|uniref:Uncharacterized protein n=1 Tax=Gordonia effusa NBRC 100432 TaxID=1077974 RepID=H0QZ61_9ACTN|nr:hypothetical protein [Gordonia effusa]GAB18112.1 hypothetical protein GOEFS_046_00680 [Gordonia effusa NBRC 100432]
MHDYDYRSIRINGRECLPEKAAQRFVGRGKTTLWDWRKRGTVLAYQVVTPDGYRRIYYAKGPLRAALRDAQRRKRDQVRVAGPGRGRQYTSAERSEAIAAGRQRKADAASQKIAARAAMRAAAEKAEQLEDALYARND